MTNKTATSPLQALVDGQALKLAEAQYRFARLWTPYGFEPERVDFDRVGAMMHTPSVAFPSPTDNLKVALNRISAVVVEATLLLDAFKAQGVTPQLDVDTLYTQARANVCTQTMTRAA